MKIDWKHVYLLGFWYPNGKRSLTSWDGYAQRVEVVVVGDGVQKALNWKNNRRIPMWDAPAPPDMEVRPFPSDVPDDTDVKIKYATEHGGVFAFGWYFEEGFERKTHA